LKNDNNIMQQITMAVKANMEDYKEPTELKELK